MTNREIAPDAVKGLCIILMVFGHLNYVGSLSKELWLLHDYIYTFHMPIFLMISGYFFSFHDSQGARAKKVLLRIGVPYLIFISLYLIGLTLVQYIGIKTVNTPPEGVLGYIKAMTTKPYGPYWFLHALIVYQLTFLLARWMSGRFTDPSKAFGLTLVFAIAILWLFHELKIIHFRPSCYFLAGVMIRSVYGKEFSIPFLPVLFVTFGFLGVDLVRSQSILNFFSPSEFVWCALLFALLWSGFQKFTNAGTGFLAWIGRNTLIILVLHALFIVAMKPLNGVFVSLDPSGVAQTIIVTGATVALCLLSSLIIDWLRLSKWMFGVDKIYSK